ncbi:MAG: two-component system, OmpR family, phosphate regulon sensor histidine kinase PhoR [Parcubacteria group bacterium Gr01-1014_70]|nr:MAG: two-component system, OmpR family, phosphate regulon sensor histidine kinase PhoR [Parcubacteria group bacterium Gr01-1014_70]
MRWSREAATLHAFYSNLAIEVERRANDLDSICQNQLENEKKILQLKDEILFVAAHELRSPVSAIKWGLTTLLEDKEFNTHISTNLKGILKQVYTHNEQLGNLVSQLLNIARIEQGVLSIKTERVYVSHSIREVFDEIKHLAEEHNIHLINKVENPPPLLADPTLVKEILINLITNAIRYNVPDGSVTITERHTDALVVINVTDTGQGIPRDQLSDVFQKFYKITQKRTLGKEKSVGLGLYITKELVTRMGGTIRAISEPGKGSTFTFTLPRDRQHT